VSAAVPGGDLKVQHWSVVFEAPAPDEMALYDAP